MGNYILKVLTVLALSATKFIFGFATALASKFNFIEVLIYCVVGGMLGVIIYIYVWHIIMKIYRKFFPAKKKKEGLHVNKFKRILVKIVMKYELYGIAFLTPILLTIPVGTLLASALEPNKWRIKKFMFVSLLGWTLFLYGVLALFGVRIDKLI